MYEGVVYFAGPQTLWSGKIASNEVMFRTSSKWLWAVRLRILSAYGPLDHYRCGYQIKNRAVIEHVKARDELSTG